MATPTALAVTTTTKNRHTTAARSGLGLAQAIRLCRMRLN
jgi:hypothetical protein